MVAAKKVQDRQSARSRQGWRRKNMGANLGYRAKLRKQREETDFDGGDAEGLRRYLRHPRTEAGQ